jgi:hypothetical protein
MQLGQPPSWRPDREQLRAEAYRGTVRDALGGLRNLEQLLGSLRVGPRALLSVLPDIQTCCPPLADAIAGLSSIVAGKLTQATDVVGQLSQTSIASVTTLAQAIDVVTKSTFNAKSRLRLEQLVSSTTRDIEATFELIELLGEVAWGRTMPISLAEMAREAFRSSEPPGSVKATIRLSLSAEIPNIERNISPRALVLILNQLVRWSVRATPDIVPRVVFALGSGESVEVRVEHNTGSGELRFASGRHVLPEAETCLRIAAEAMGLQLEIHPRDGKVRLVFGADEH